VKELHLSGAGGPFKGSSLPTALGRTRPKLRTLWEVTGTMAANMATQKFCEARLLTNTTHWCTCGTDQQGMELQLPALFVTEHKGRLTEASFCIISFTYKWNQVTFSARRVVHLLHDFDG